MSKKSNEELDIVASITEIDTAELLKKAKDTYSKKYGDQLAQLIEDNMRLEKALKFVRGHIKRVADGDILAIEEYLESRDKLERE